MMNPTALLSTSPLAVEDWLRSLANPSELLKLRESGQSEYPYLFGMATVKLAEAHREYLRLLAKLAEINETCDCGDCASCDQRHEERTGL